MTDHHYYHSITVEHHDETAMSLTDLERSFFAEGDRLSEEADAAEDLDDAA